MSNMGGLSELRHISGTSSNFSGSYRNRKDIEEVHKSGHIALMIFGCIKHH